MSSLVAFKGKSPKVASDAFIADGACLIGDVEVANGASVWFNVVLRGDFEAIKIGERTNIQDGSVIHVDGEHPTIIGKDVLVGHGAIIHGCQIGDEALIGIGAILLNGSRVGEGAIVAAGSLVPEGKEVPPHTLAMGSPCKVVREVKPAEKKRTADGVRIYSDLAAEYRR